MSAITHECECNHSRVRKCGAQESICELQFIPVVRQSASLK